MNQKRAMLWSISEVYAILSIMPPTIFICTLLIYLLLSV